MIADGGFDDAAVGNERGQSLTDVAGAHVHPIADLLMRERFTSLGEDLFDAFPAGRLAAGGRWLLIDELQYRRILFEDQWQPVSTRSGTMLDAELQLSADATHVQI